MPALPNPAILTANGSYDIKLRAGFKYLLTLKGVFGGATVAITTKAPSDQSGETFDTVTGGTWTAGTEQILISPSDLARLTVTNSSGTTSIRVVCLATSA